MGQEEDKHMKTLRKSSSNRMIAGVCGGVAEYFNIDPTLVRLAFVAGSIIFGSGVLAYIVAAVIMPEGREDHSRDIIPADEARGAKTAE